MRSKPGVTTPAPALGQEMEETPPISEPQLGLTTPAPALGQEMEETPPISEPQLGVTTPAPALGKEKDRTLLNPKPRPGEATPAPALGQEMDETPPISEPWHQPAGPFQRSLSFSFLHSGASEMSPPNELKFLPWWEWQQ